MRFCSMARYGGIGFGGWGGDLDHGVSLFDMQKKKKKFKKK